MANIFFVKDGQRANGERITHRANISTEVALKAFGGHQARYSANPPTVNPSIVTSDFQPYKHVVLELSEGETTASYPQIGYYLIEGLEASECQRMLGLNGPTI